MRNQSTSPRRLLARAAVVVAAALGLLAVYSCSLIVETSSTQCQTDMDCANIAGYPKCNTATGVCVTNGSSSSSGMSSSGTTSSSSGSPPSCDVDGGIDAGGCYDTSLAMCSMNLDNSQLLNGCTTGCIAFDNTRVTLLDGGVLPALPNPGPDGGM
jgi:hypothetical protein